MGYGAVVGQTAKPGLGAQIQLNINSSNYTSFTATSPSGKVYNGSVIDGYWTVTGLSEYGTYTLSAQGSNPYTGSIDISICQQYSVTPILSTLNDNSWAIIQTVAQQSLGDNYWAVGDRKAVTVNGTVGTQAINGTYYVYILGFNHNSSREGTGITFGTFKTALSGGKDICLVDSHYNDDSTGGQKWFNMNHSSNTNSGGWKGCDLRYDVLGSTNSNNNDAGTTTATSPVSGTLMAALPSDLRAVMKPMNIYTDNTGGGSDTASYVTASVDYLPLLAEFEIFGTRSYANSAEQNYQAQYQYYKNGNSKVKYRHSATSSTAMWWERSPYYGGSGNFCGLSRDGTAASFPAKYSIGLAPIFRVG